mgnify:CR=1 FL=1
METSQPDLPRNRRRDGLDLGKRALRKNSLHTCACSRAATVKKAGAWICDRCIELESRYYGTDSLGRRLNAHAGGNTR